MTQIVAQGYGLHEVLVKQEGFADGPCDLRNLEGVGETGPVVVVGGEKEDLCFILQPAKGLAVHDPIPVGEIAKPPFVHLPDPLSLFRARAERLRALAQTHGLRPYLLFLAGLSDGTTTEVMGEGLTENMDVVTGTQSGPPSRP